jgi:hypothetical protein
MVDAAKPDLFPAAKEGLLTLLSKEQLAGIPVRLPTLLRLLHLL